MGKKTTTEDFIKKANLVHNNRYSYSKAVYTKSSDFIIITCSIHGDFSQRANCHSNGKGCKKCGLTDRAIKRTYTNEQFIEKANLLFNSKYSYDLVNYKNSNSVLNIICLEHGIFNKKASKHLQGQGCPECSKINHPGKFKNSTTDAFLASAKVIHGDLYDYSNVVYISAIENIKIICKTHGEFEQTPHTHLTGGGCNTCGIERTANKRRSTLEYFLNKSNNKHNHKYSYDKVVYKNTQTKVTISCPLHGDFIQTPGSHLAGNGCPTCSTIISYYKGRISNKDISEAKEIKCLLYVIEFQSKEEHFWKIGITSNYIARMKALRKETDYLIKDVSVLVWNKFDCVSLEQYIIKKYNHLNYKPNTYFKGHTECFSVNPYTTFKEFKTLNYNTPLI